MRQAIDNAEENLIHCGKELLAKTDYRNLTIQAIASASGMAIGTFYNYFRSKDEFIHRILNQEWDELLSRMEAKIKPGCAHKCAGHFIYHLIESYERKYAWYVSALCSGNSRQSEKYRLSCEENRRSLYQMLAKKLKAETASGGFEIQLDYEKAVAYFVQLCGSTARNANLCFEDLWRFLHFRDLKA